MTESAPDLQKALDALRLIATPAEIREAAARGAAPPERPRCNAHVHLPPNFSAFESVEQVVRLAREQGRTVIAVTHEAVGAAYADRIVVLQDGRIVGEIEPTPEADATLVAARYTELVG